MPLDQAIQRADHEELRATLATDTASIATRAVNIDGETRVGDLIDLLLDMGEHASLEQLERITAEVERLAATYLAEHSVPASFQRRLPLHGGARAH